MTRFGLDDKEARTVADEFGVAIEQVRRDHLISHILAALSTSHTDQLIFFGGTALARTYLPAGRLSEDVDLIATSVRRDTAASIEQTLERALRRSHGRISWAPRLTAVRDADAAVLVADEGRLTARLQLLDHLGYPPWPTELHAMDQRYADAGPATLRVPTAASFAAWKTVAWHDRNAPRDLCDLWALAQHGEITARAAELFVAHGPISNAPTMDVHLGPDRGSLASPARRPDTLDRHRGRSAPGRHRRMGACGRGNRLLTTFVMLD